MKKLDVWAIVAAGAGGGVLLFATELAKVIPGPDDQVLAAAGAVMALCGILLQVHTRGKSTPQTTDDVDKLEGKQ